MSAGLHVVASTTGALAAGCASLLVARHWEAAARRRRLARLSNLTAGKGAVGSGDDRWRRREARWPAWVVFAVGCTLGMALAGARGVSSAPAALAAGAAAAWAFRWAGAMRRRAAAVRAGARFSEQLVLALGTVTSSVRAGLTLMQGLETAAADADQPLRGHLLAVVQGYTAGLPVEEALATFAAGAPSLDAAYFVRALRLGQEQGGNLAELLAHIAETVRERQRLRGDLLARTAEARLTVRLLSGLPVAMLLLMALAQRDGLRALVDSAAGRAAAAYAAASWAAGVRTAHSMLAISGLRD